MCVMNKRHILSQTEPDACKSVFIIRRIANNVARLGDDMSHVAERPLYNTHL